MKLFKNILIAMIALVFVTACDDGIDSISYVKPGVDETAPVVKINYPTEGTTIKVIEVVSTINIDIEVTDDIEIATISVLMDGNEIASFNTFNDYRRALEEFTYDNLTSGDHILTVTASDLEGKSTTSTVNFTKEPPYSPLFDGEFFYMPFDGDYIDLVNITSAPEVGFPGFAGESVVGIDAYAGTTDSYLTYPVNGMLSDEFSAAFWYKVSATPDRAGILVIGANADDRNQGFRLFREGNADEQRIKLNVGSGDGESWNDGAVIDVAAGEWVHITMTISNNKNTLFFNGVEMMSSDMTSGVDWTGCETMTIGAGGETFSYWDHKSDGSAMDELRLFNKALTSSEIQNMINVTVPYEPKYDGEIFYMPFDGDNTELINGTVATEVGSPGFAGEGVKGENSYAGATDSYITFPSDGLLNEEFSAVFWIKVDADPDRAGILVMGPPDGDKTENMNNRQNGFRFFREGDATNQTFKLNVGNGEADAWFDGGANASIDPTTADWVHIAFTISSDYVTVYKDGIVVAEGDFGPIDWTGCDVLSIMSGAPRFTEWGHSSDNSLMDELRLFNKALSQEEIQTIIDDEN